MTDGQINKKNTGPHETHQIQTTPKRLNHTFDGSQKSKKSEKRKTWRRKEELEEREREREKMHHRLMEIERKRRAVP